MPITAEQARNELRRRRAARELSRRRTNVPFPEVPDTVIPEEYKDMGDRIRNAYYYSRTLGIDPNLTFDHEKELNETLYEKGISSASAWNRTKKQYEKINLWMNTKRAWMQSSKSWGAEHAGFLAMTEQISYKEALKISKQFKKYARENPIRARNWYEKQYVKLIGMAPAILGGKAEGAKYGLIGAGVGAAASSMVGQVPPLTFLPDEAFTIPGGVFGGMMIGKISGEMKFWSEQGAGAIYLAAREQNISHRTASIAAAIGGPVYGAIEFSQIDRLSPSLAKFKKNILTVALEIAKDIGMEVTEEGLQRATTDGAVLISKIFEKKIKALDVPAETLTIAMNSWQEMKESVVPMTILMGPKSGMATLNVLMEGSERGIEDQRIANLEPEMTEILAPEEPAKEAIKAPPEPAKAIKPAEPTITPKPEAKPEEKLKEFETPEEAKEAEAKLETEAAEEVEPELYIGHVTEGMKKRIEEKTQFKADDIKGFHKPTGGPWPTIREKIKMTRGEAEKYLEWLVEDLKRRLDNNLINTENDLAKANADWGDIKNLREVLGMKKTIRPFTVERAEKHKIKIIPNLKSRIYEAIRPAEESKMTVGEVLSAVLKRSARYAKMGYIKGRQELRAQMRIKARAKKRINKALKTINQKIPKAVDFFYREAIEALRGDLDLKNRSKRTEATIRSRKEFLRRVPEEALELIPVKQIKQLGQKPLNEFTIEELEDVANQVDELIKQGKLKRKLKLKPELKQREKDITELTENTEQIRKADIPESPHLKKEESWIKKYITNAVVWTWTPSRLFDWLDGRKNFSGLWHKVFYDGVKAEKRKFLEWMDIQKKRYLDELKARGLSLTGLSEMKRIGEKNYEIQYVMGVYMASKNSLSKLHLKYGHDFTDAMIKNFSESLTENEKAFADWMLDWYEENYPALRKAVIEQENRDMRKEEFYSPIIPIDSTWKTLQAEMIKQMEHRAQLRGHHVAHGFSLARKDVPPYMRKEIRLDAVNIFVGHINKHGRYIYLGPQVRRMKKIMQNRKLRDTVKNRFGEEALRKIDGYVAAQADPYIYRQFDKIEKLSAKMRQNVGLAYLGWNVVVMGKQLVSNLYYLSDAGPSHLFASWVDFALDPMKMIREVRARDPEVADRVLEREFAELTGPNSTFIRQKYGNALLSGIFFFDTIARTVGWNAVYQRAINTDKVSEAEAIRRARNSTLRTQPAAAAEDIPQLYRTSEFLNIMMQFTNQLNKIWNIASYDIPSYFVNEQYREAALQSFAFASAAMFIYMISHRKLPDEPEEMAEALTEQMLNMLPLIGKPIMAARRGWESDIPVFEGLKAVGVAIKSIEDLDLSKSDSKKIAEGISVTTGIPYIMIRRIVKMIEEEKPEAMLGY